MKIHGNVSYLHRKKNDDQISMKIKEKIRYHIVVQQYGKVNGEKPARCSVKFYFTNAFLRLTD